MGTNRRLIETANLSVMENRNDVKMRSTEL